MRRLLVSVRLTDLDTDKDPKLGAFEHAASIEMREYHPGKRLAAAIDAGQAAFDATYKLLKADGEPVGFPQDATE